MSIKVLVNGASGRMGQETVAALAATDDLECVATPSSKSDLAQAIATSQADIVVDFTHAAVAYENARIIVEANVSPVIGTSGFTEAQVNSLQQHCATKKLGGLIAPNFSIGAILMMKFSAQAAHYFKHMEIIEMHHDQKRDAPSGTAMKTAEMIATARGETPLSSTTTQETIPGSRGATYDGVPIHAVRLPGLLAHQKVIMSEYDQILEIRHDSLHRRSFMPGVCLACRKVLSLNELVYGLEHLL